MKKCTKCKKRKPFEAFGKNSRAADKRQYWCRDCANDAERDRRARKKAEAAPCSTGCGRIAVTADMCHRCYNRDRYGNCTADGCHRAATGRHGLCLSHIDKGTCEVDNCQSPGQAKVAGQMLCTGHYCRAKYGECTVDDCEQPAHGRHGLCQAHRLHDRGLARPRKHNTSTDPHGLYVWRFLSGVPVYVGISSRPDVRRRNYEHLNNVERGTSERFSPWADHAWAPESFSFVYPTRQAARDAEAAAIHLATRTFGPLANNKHSPGSGRGLELDEVVAKAAQGRRGWIKHDPLDLGDMECLALDWALDRAVVETYSGDADNELSTGYDPHG